MDRLLVAKSPHAMHAYLDKLNVNKRSDLLQSELLPMENYYLFFYLFEYCS